MNDDEKEFFRRNNFSSKSLLLRIYFSDIEKRSLNNRENLRWCAFAELSNFVRRLRRSHTFFVFLTSRRRREASRVCYFCVFCGSITSWPMPTTACIGPTTCLNANFFFSFFFGCVLSVSHSLRRSFMKRWLALNLPNRLSIKLPANFDIFILSLSVQSIVKEIGTLFISRSSIVVCLWLTKCSSLWRWKWSQWLEITSTKRRG